MHEWQQPAPYPHAENFSGKIPDNWQELFPGVSDKSLQEINNGNDITARTTSALGEVIEGIKDVVDDVRNYTLTATKDGCKIDFEKLVSLMEENDAFPDFKEEVDFYIIPVDNECFDYALYVSECLRDLGAIVEIHYKEYDLKRLDDLLDRVNVTYSLVIDEDDAKNKTIKVRNSLNKRQSVVMLKDFIKDLNAFFKFVRKII